MARPEPRKATSHAPTEPVGPNVFAWMGLWLQDEGLWWMSSFAFHMALVCSLALIGAKTFEKIVDEAPAFEDAGSAVTGITPPEIERFELGDDSGEDPTEQPTDLQLYERPAAVAQEEAYFDDNPEFSDKGGGGIANAPKDANFGGLGGFDMKALGAGPAVHGQGGVGLGAGFGTRPGSGGEGTGFGGRATGHRKAMLASGGGTKQSERAVLAALNWLARHQMPDGSWSIPGFNSRCKGETCTNPGSANFNSAATAFGLLPFLAAGQTPESKGPYKKHLSTGINWLIKNQKPDGDLRAGGNLYAHGLAAIALCECYGISGNRQVGRAAQSALNFIVQSQDPNGGGWRYEPRQPGDTSVAGWQVMALKSGQMASLHVPQESLEKARAFLIASSTGQNQGLFCYQPGDKLPKLATTAVGLLCQQYLHMPRTEPAMVEGVACLMKHPPELDGPDGHNLYYWYYATQVMHNMPGPDWDTWNRKMRRLLIDTQIREGCAMGSWDSNPKAEPKNPANDEWGAYGGRLMMTSLSALTLEVYYRYLPLYKLDTEDNQPKSDTEKSDASMPATAPSNDADQPATP